MTTSIRRGALAFAIGAAGTALSGAVVQLAVQPTTDVSDDRWSYPWSAGTFAVVTAFYALLHLLITAGLVAFARAAATGPSRAGRAGTALAVAGTLLLTLAELASIPLRDAAMDDTGAVTVGSMFGLGTLISAIGLLLAGRATLKAGVWQGWRRYTPLAAGIWTALLLVISFTKALPGGVGVYGVLLLGMAVALYSQAAPASTARQPVAAHR